MLSHSSERLFQCLMLLVALLHHSFQSLKFVTNFSSNDKWHGKWDHGNCRVRPRGNEGQGRHLEPSAETTSRHRGPPPRQTHAGKSGGFQWVSDWFLFFGCGVTTNQFILLLSFDVLCHALESLTAIHYSERTPRPTNPIDRPAYQVKGKSVWSPCRVFSPDFVWN